MTVDVVAGARDLAAGTMVADVAVDGGWAARVQLLSSPGLVAHSLPIAADDAAVDARHHERMLRALSAESLLLPAGLDRGFRIEDMVLLVVAAPIASHAAITHWWRRRLGPQTTIDCQDAPDSGVMAVFTTRGQVPTSQRLTYQLDASRDGRIAVEAFELHVTEHCNLRCAHCCNMSPYLSHKVLSPSAIAATLLTMSQVMHADVFKIMGGEPLLHPEITEVLRVVRRSGVGDVVRLFTNGLLLTKMDDDFWRALDHLTISTYDSAPVRPDHLAIIEDRAYQFDVVLNVKPVDAFSQVMHSERRDDDAAVQQTWNRCWLRHRCLVVRDERFYICTRAAYLTDMHDRVALTNPYDDPARRRMEDGVDIHDPQLADHVLQLLNRSQPLHACRFCLGGDGPRESHRQLSRDDVTHGRLHRLPILPILP